VLVVEGGAHEQNFQEDGSMIICFCGMKRTFEVRSDLSLSTGDPAAQGRAEQSRAEQGFV
jgi:hypothetical protein